MLITMTSLVRKRISQSAFTGQNGMSVCVSLRMCVHLDTNMIKGSKFCVASVSLCSIHGDICHFW